ncbi:hypothetical protein BCR36DRAFT_371493 [Piromyces finnis]|uniref:Uncharacterized protein n=1 Tax=Piromyces finnis TaxID=1754191 RepID=A0A1Y1V6S8_9FUNG|nr:hypothetical protein BCR36DRAFT_371493 [Piromyces finnis]|eukprot:ORX47854.1 hypothetical protein BCR36DRAFT_371493 [Piromyces finnis]
MKNYSTIIKNNPEDNENIEVKKNVFRDNSKIDLFTFIIVTIITAIFMILPLSTIFLIRNHSLGELELIFVSTKRTYYSQAIQTWAHELFYMDSETYRRGEPSAFILEAVNTLESLEKSINKGTYGGKSVDKYQILKPLTQNNGCIRGTGDESTCDSRVYDENYTEQIANSPLDVIISEYIIKTRDFISSFTNNYQEVQYTKEDAQKRLEKLNSNSYIIFHNKIIQEINGHVKKMNEVLVADIINNINTTIKLVDFLHVVSMIFIPLIYFYYFRNFAKRKLREMETLTIVFSNIPRSVCEKSTKIKLFIRHGTLESTF